MTLAIYTFTVSLIYAAVAVASPQLASALVVFFIGLLLVPASLAEAGRALTRRQEQRQRRPPHA